MKKIILLLLIIHCQLSIVNCFSQNIFISESSHITFFSEAPLENIEAVNTASTSIITLFNDSIAFQVPIKGFTFEKPLMQEHFNENYMESDKKGMEYAILKAKFNEKPDFKTDGEYKLSCTGTILIHGVQQTRTFDGTITVKAGKPSIKSEFIVKLQDHKVKIPKAVIKNIAEEVKVTVSANYKPYSK